MDTQYYTMRDALQELITRFYGPEDEPDDQTAKADNGKPKLTLVPRAIIYAIAWVRMYGCEKYKDPDNWKKVSAQRYWEAVLRHTLAAWWNFRAKDQESGLMHIEHIACNLAFIIEIIKGEENDGTRSYESKAG